MRLPWRKSRSEFRSKFRSKFRSNFRFGPGFKFRSGFKSRSGDSVKATSADAPLHEFPLHEFMLPAVLPRRAGDLGHVLQAKHWPSDLFFALDAERRQLHTIEHRAPPLDADRHRFSGAAKKRQNHALSMFRRVRAGQLFVDFEHARLFAPEVSLGRPLQVFQYNRRVGDRTAVLWRYPGHFAPGPHLGCTGGQAPEDQRRFRDKRPVVFWRGHMIGSRWCAPGRRETLSATLPPDALPGAARHFSRVEAVLRSRRQPGRYDFRFVSGNVPRAGAVPCHERHASMAAFLECRYVLCPNGHDVPTQLYWVLATRSLAFKEDSVYEVIPDYFLKPWVHYVPVARGLADLDDKYEWCERHPDACERMLDAANEAYRRMQDPAPWRAAEDVVLDRLGLT